MSDAHPENEQATVLSALSFIGFGEAGQAFASGIGRDAPQVHLSAFDIKTNSADEVIASEKWQDYAGSGISGCATLDEAVGATPLVLSFVTADQAFVAATNAAQAMPAGALYLDCNSCAPDTKRASAEVLEAAGIRYVDTAVMSPVHPALHRARLLMSGSHAEDAARIGAALGMQISVVPGDTGRASSIKMLRSVMIKGIEALVLEGFLAARKAGVEQEVIASLDASFPGWDWTARAGYNLERATKHGLRRAAEMSEVAKTLEDLGMMNDMSRATCAWQQAVGELGLSDMADDFANRADALLTALEESR